MKRLLLPVDSPLAVTIKNAHGGSPKDVIRHARKAIQGRSYQRCLILMDTDIPWPENIQARLHGVPTTYVGSDPCLEGMLLAILSREIPATSSEAKDELERHCISEKGKYEPTSYSRLFPTELLQERRETVEPLDSILSFLDI